MKSISFKIRFPSEQYTEIKREAAKAEKTFGQFIRDRIKASQIDEQSFFDRVYAAVRTIPKGRVATYGQIARIIGTRDARRIGHALHANRDPNTPYHRVVFADGSLAPGYAFGGPNKQRKRLESEGVKFTENGKVDLTKHRLHLH